MTSTLQQEAGRKLRLSAQTTMRVAQGLYENGFITYMRTDSTTLSESALDAARARPASSTARSTSPTCRAATSARSRTRRRRTRRSARRVTPSARPAQVAGELSRRRVRALRADLEAHGRLADGRRARADRDGAARRDGSDGRDAEFSASGTVITFRGFLAAYEEGRDDEDSDDASGDGRASVGCRRCASGDALAVLELDAGRPRDEPAAPATPRPTLVKALEERGIGRPSTYASILGTIVDRGYVFKRGSALVPSWLAFAVDRPAGEALRRARRLRLHRRDGGGPRPHRRRPRRRVAVAAPVLLRRRRGRGPRGSRVAHGGLRQLVDNLGDIDARESTPSRSATASCCGSAATARTSSAPARRGPRRATCPRTWRPTSSPSRRPRSCWPSRAATASSASTRRPAADRAKAGRYGPYVTEVLPDDAAEARRSRAPASLFKTMSLDTVTLDDALRLLSLPRVVGVDPERARRSPRRTAATGRTSRRAPTRGRSSGEDQLFDITLEQALAIYAQPKQRGRGARRAAAARARRRPGRPGSPSWSRRAASARTSPTARRTRRCARRDPSSRVTDRARCRAAGREARPGPATKKRAGQEGRRRRRRLTKTAAKKTTAKKTVLRRRARPRRRPRRRQLPRTPHSWSSNAAEWVFVARDFMIAKDPSASATRSFVIMKDPGLEPSRAGRSTVGHLPQGYDGGARRRRTPSLRWPGARPPCRQRHRARACGGSACRGRVPGR